jgi:DNA repair protein RadD
MELRDYQAESIERVRQSLRTHDSVILQQPTGSGKTVIAGEIIKKVVEAGKTCMFVADRTTLIDQTSASFDDFGIDHGVIQRDHWRTNYHKPVQVASIQTLARRKPHHADIIIVDEAHTLYKKQVEMLSKYNSKFIGLTATPYTKGLGLHWQDLIVGATTQELIDKGYLSDFVVYAPPPVDLSGIRTVGGDYNQKQLGARVNQTEPIGDIVATWKKYGMGNQTICFGVNVEHSKHIVEQFNAAGVSALHIDAYDDPSDRRRAIMAYKNQDIKVISCVDILTKGFDEPHTGTLIMARPTKSLIVHLQQIGRVLRVAEGKGEAIILDHGANVERHGFPTDESLPVKLDVTPKGQRQETQKKEKLPKACPSCSFVKPAGVHACPKCGFEPKRVNHVEAEDGKLVKLKKNHSISQRQNFYSGLLGYAEDKGYSQGWAAHAYRDKYDTWPNDLQRVATEPTASAINWVKHMNIRKRYSKRR